MQESNFCFVSAIRTPRGSRTWRTAQSGRERGYISRQLNLNGSGTAGVAHQQPPVVSTQTNELEGIAGESGREARDAQEMKDKEAEEKGPFSTCSRKGEGK